MEDDSRPEVIFRSRVRREFGSVIHRNRCSHAIGVRLAAVGQLWQPRMSHGIEIYDIAIPT